MIVPSRKTAESEQGDGAAAPLWPFAVAQLTLDSWFWWLQPRAEKRLPLPWTTPNEVALELTTMQLRDFSCGSAAHPVLVCAPLALHKAQIADFASGHSIMETLRQGGVERLYLTDWRSATSAMRYLSIDSYLADLNVAVDDLGEAVDLVGLCQGGWLSALYAARFPRKVRRLVLVGAPLDLSTPSSLARLVQETPATLFEELVARGGGNVSGRELHRFWSKPAGQRGIEAALQRELDTPDGAGLLERFLQWNEETLDLPGVYYLDVVTRIFRDNAIAEGTFVALGRAVSLRQVQSPVYLLAGLEDEIVPAAQGLSAARLFGTPPDRIRSGSEPCAHLALFLGRKTHADSWRQIAGWLHGEAGDRLAPNA